MKRGIAGLLSSSVSFLIDQKGDLARRFEVAIVSTDDKEHLDLLLQSSALLNSTLDLDEVLKSLLEQASRIVGAENGFILLKSNGDWDIHLSVNESELFSKSVANHAVQSGKTVLLLDAFNDDRFRSATSVQVASVRSILCSPLRWEQEFRGVVYLDNRVKEGVFNKEHERLIDALSQQAAVALENAALHRERERVHAEALSQAREELAQTQAQLFNASKMAAVGELAAGIAHEVNNPLCAIALNLDTVSKQVEQPGLIRRLGIMTEAVERCRSIIDRLLHFSHPSLAEWRPLRMDQLVAETLEFMQFQLKGIELVSHLEELSVEGDASAIIQVLINLLANCKDALDGKGGRIEIRCLKTGVMEIQDDGCGMDDEVKERLFEPFFTTKTVGQGTGLGLAISYQILKEHSVEIEVESELGVGTTFRLKFQPLETDCEEH